MADIVLSFEQAPQGDIVSGLLRRDDSSSANIEYAGPVFGQASMDIASGIEIDKVIDNVVSFEQAPQGNIVTGLFRQGETASSATEQSVGYRAVQAPLDFAFGVEIDKVIDNVVTFEMAGLDFPSYSATRRRAEYGFDISVDSKYNSAEIYQYWA